MTLSLVLAVQLALASDPVSSAEEPPPDHATLVGGQWATGALLGAGLTLALLEISPGTAVICHGPCSITPESGLSMFALSLLLVPAATASTVWLMGRLDPDWDRPWLTSFLAAEFTHALVLGGALILDYGVGTRSLTTGGERLPVSVLVLLIASPVLDALAAALAEHYFKVPRRG